MLRCAIRRQYRRGTLVLETVFDTKDGSVALIDFMTATTGNSSLVRIVEGRSGEVAMRLDLALRFDYGSTVPWVTRLQHRTGLRAVAGPDLVLLTSDVPLQGVHLTTVAGFTVSAGQRVHFVLSHGQSHVSDPTVPDAGAALAEAEQEWAAWSDRWTYHGQWREQVQRSLLTLKALTYQPTGGIVAAPTTSLPEQFGGERNWDYRYCWLRDATLTLLALAQAGYTDEARAWGAWLRRSVAGTPAQVQTLYGLAGERWLLEWEVPWLAGYGGARPVRIGNAASSAAAGRCVWRVAGCDVSGNAPTPGATGGELAHPAGADRAPDRRLGAAGREHLGSARRSEALHVLQGDGLGGGRPGDPRRRGVPSAGETGRMARAATADP